MKCEFTQWITPQGCGSDYKVKSICKKEAITVKNGKYLCRHHARLGRFVIRKGDVGEIIFRCDTEQELRDKFIKYSNHEYRMQKVTRSYRKDLF